MEDGDDSGEEMPVDEMQKHVPPQRRGGAKHNAQAAAGATAAASSEDGDGEHAANPDVEYYIRNCQRYQVPVDPSVVISLKTRWHVMQPTKSFCEGSMLPLAGILDTNRHVKRLSLKGAGMHTNRRPAAGNGNSNARVLHTILSRNDCVEALDVSATGLDDDGLAEICEALKQNKSITHLSVAQNRFGTSGCAALEAALDANETLSVLDISRNALGFSSVRSLQHKFQSGPRRGRCGCCIKLDGNYVFEEILNAMSHGLGFLASVVGAILLMSEATAPGKTQRHFWGCAIFSASLMLLYLASTLFHSLFMIPHASRVLQVADHCAIYFLIAGSYTPFMLVGLYHLPVARVVLVAEWLAALGGCVFSMASDLFQKSTMYVELLFYLAMGLAVFCVWPQVRDNLPWEVILLLVGGGAAYVFGVIFFVAGNTVPIYHTVWHVFVMVASAMHWFAIFFFVVHAPSDGVPGAFAEANGGVSMGLCGAGGAGRACAT